MKNKQFKDELTINQLIKFDSTIGLYPVNMKPIIIKQLEIISSLFRECRVPSTIKNIIATPPFYRHGDIMIFHAFATNRTAYGIIHKLEKIFTDWYLQTEVLPIIKPLSMKYFYEPKTLPYYNLRQIRERGVKIYSNANTK